MNLFFFCCSKKFFWNLEIPTDGDFDGLKKFDPREATRGMPPPHEALGVKLRDKGQPKHHGQRRPQIETNLYGLTTNSQIVMPYRL
jgi:hypothetical protein